MDDKPEKIVVIVVGASALVLVMAIAWWMIFVMAIQVGIMYLAYRFGYDEAEDDAETWLFWNHREAWQDWKDQGSDRRLPPPME